MGAVITLHGTNEARCGSLSVKGRGMSGPICPMARKLINDEGYDPDENATIYRDGTICFTPATLGWWASKQCRESDKLSARFYDYQEFWGAAE